MTKKPVRSTGNVFRDLGFPSKQAEHLRIRSALMARARALGARLIASDPLEG